ncbi:MAG: hypothetical protein ACK5LP_05155 [Campylobacteraceae bacterium]
MLQAKTENNIVISIVDGDELLEGYVTINENINMSDDIRFFDENWQKKPLQTLIDENLITLVDDEKIENETIVKKTDYDLVKEGVKTLGDYEYFDDEIKTIKTQTAEWLYKNNHITQEQYETLYKKEEEQKEAEYRASIPTELTAYQARAALLEFELLDDIEAAMPSMDRKIQLAWEYAQTFKREHEFIQSLITQFGINEEQLDQLFIQGAKYE